MMSKRIFKSAVEVSEVRNNARRLRPAKVLVERRAGRGRPKHFLSRSDNKTFSKLLKYFFVPLVNALDLGDDPSEKMSFADRITFIFGANHRDVIMAIATQNFIMPGVMWLEDNPAELVNGGPLDTRILKGTTLMVRIDERMPDRIDIERCDTKEGLTFLLTRAQYESIYKHMKEVAGCNERLTPPGVRGW